MRVAPLRSDGGFDGGRDAESGAGLGALWGAGNEAAAVAAAHVRLLLLADRLTRTVSVARALIATGRTVDLSGFEDGVGVLCAKTLDMHREESRPLLPAMLELAAQIDRLSLAVRDQQERRGQQRRGKGRGLAQARP
jgi:hypothetical protein